ncbi:MAG: hypothetical protein WAQ26_01810 [Candidatus Saccharimonas aalborgensis]
MEVLGTTTGLEAPLTFTVGGLQYAHSRLPAMSSTTNPTTPMIVPRVARLLC